MNRTVRAYMLGRMSLAVGDRVIDDSQNRSRKVWALLAVLMLNHGRVVRQSELIDLLWSDEREGANPVNTLKTTLHRARAVLSAVAPETGSSMIVHTQGGYAWNEDFRLDIDVEEFERLCVTPEEPEPDGGLERLRRAIGLYQGAFLEKFSAEIWVLPKTAYYQELYLQAVNRALELMQAGALYEQAEQVCCAALRHEPYREELYQHRMRDLLALGRQSQAVEVYESMSRLLLSELGVMPDAESRRLYREALRTVNRRTVAPEVVREQLRESDPITGAVVCDYDFFKFIYRAEARMLARNGAVIHIGMLSVSAADGASLPRRSLELAMDNLEQLLQANLRKGDIITRCSPSQFVLMLPLANYENSCAVCRRVRQAFARRYPHSPAQVEFMVYPVEPSIEM